MLEGTEAVTRASLSLALDAATLRHQVIANNIANANTQDFIPQRVNFEAHVRDARRQLDERGYIDAQTASAMTASPLPVEPMLAGNGQAARVQLDVEVAEMARNAVHYQALVKALSREMSVLSIAVNDGKR